MSRYKIMDWKAISSDSMDGLNEQAKELIKNGFVPHGEIRCTYSPTYTFHGTATQIGGTPTFTKEFVKYCTFENWKKANEQPKEI